jgi:hypothetical protein
VRGFRRVVSLLLSGKVSPWATLLRRPIPGIQHVRRLFRTLLRIS